MTQLYTDVLVQYMLTRGIYNIQYKLGIPHIEIRPRLNEKENMARNYIWDAYDV